jgi:hypothetical protein
MGWEHGSNVTNDIQWPKMNAEDYQMMCPCPFALGCFAVPTIDMEKPG